MKRFHRYIQTGSVNAPVPEDSKKTAKPEQQSSAELDAFISRVENELLATVSDQVVQFYPESGPAVLSKLS